jgi:hypothetical protein
MQGVLEGSLFSLLNIDCKLQRRYEKRSSKSGNNTPTRFSEDEELIEDQDNQTIPNSKLEQKEDPEKAARMRKNIIQEIVSSEEKYLQDLYTLMLYYITPLRNGRFPEISSNPKGDITVSSSSCCATFTDYLRCCSPPFN